MEYLAIVSVIENRVVKYQEFSSMDGAQKHAKEVGGFVYKNAAETPIDILFVDGQTVTAVHHPVSEQNVRAECARRLFAAFEARDQAHLDRLISEATMDAIELLSIGFDNLNEQQSLRVKQLNGGRALVKAHDAASKSLRATDPIPTDYTDDKYWP